MFSPLETDRFTRPASAFAPGPVPMLEWIEVKRLIVDRSYQRGITKTGKNNIHRIVEEFDWSKFAPVIVAPVEGGLYAIVDGQHRTTAAMLRDIPKVPCQIVLADRAQQAAAFAAVNGNVTKTTQAQIFNARLTSGDPRSRAISDICVSAGVTIVRTNRTLSSMRPGETTAVRSIARCYEKYGEQTITLALKCVTKTADGNAGFLRPTVIEALCHVLGQYPGWCEDEQRLLAHMDKFCFLDQWDAIAGEQDRVFPFRVKTSLAQSLEKFLKTKFAKVQREAVALQAAKAR